MFSESLPGILERAAVVGTEPPLSRAGTAELADKAAAGESLPQDEIFSLINGLSDPANAEVVLDRARSQRRPNDDQVLLLPPLYFSSICENTCAYCDFSLGGGTRLSTSGFQKEVDALIELGYRSIELVSSQDPDLYVHCEGFDLDDQRFDLKGAARYFQILRSSLGGNGGGMITSNIPPVDTDSFRVLRDAGLNCYLVWLETFDTTQYRRLHSRYGPKGNQAYRVDSFERARAAGIEHVAGAFLKGLAEWRKEEMVLYLFDRYLKDRFGHGFSIIGSPRVKGRFVRSGAIRQFDVSDEEYELNIALDRLLFDGILWLQTRESFDFNRRLINSFGGGVILTLTSSTAPGGYAAPAEVTSQFPVYKQNLDAAVEVLKGDGFDVRFSWNAEHLAACQRNGYSNRS
ncbi:MAG: radical SAM protein [Acidobacteria bacterium]|nr:radical SAM protein [Acidobacteriota bacterium]